MTPIKPQYLYELDSIGEYGAMEVSSFEYESALKEKMFETEGLQSPFDYFYFDVPQIFQDSKFGLEFILALLEHYNINEDIEIFSHESI